MSVLPLLIAPHPLLSSIAAPVEGITKDILSLLEDMLDTMYAHEGIGLAANQVGILKRLIVIDLQESGQRSPMKLINPEILWVSPERRQQTEACLSLPAQKAEVERPERIAVRYQDERGGVQEIQAEGLLSVCLQHEINHLDGLLYVDHLSSLKRNLILERLRKFKQKNK